MALYGMPPGTSHQMERRRVAVGFSRPLEVIVNHPYWCMALSAVAALAATADCFGEGYFNYRSRIGNAVIELCFCQIC